MEENTLMEYNTQRPPLRISEYGRNIHKMIEYACSLEDREQRNNAAKTIVAIMAAINNPQKQDTPEFRQKLWDHLFIMSDFKLDVDSPFPKPDPNAKDTEIVKCSYPNKFIRFRQYGKNIENMIQKATEYEEGEEKQALIKYLANHLKKLYLNWNRESVSNEVIFEHLAILSDGKLKPAEDLRLEHAHDLLAINNNKKNSGSKQGEGKNKHRGNWKKRRNN